MVGICCECSPCRHMPTEQDASTSLGAAARPRRLEERLREACRIRLRCFGWPDVMFMSVEIAALKRHWTEVFQAAADQKPPFGERRPTYEQQQSEGDRGRRK